MIKQMKFRPFKAIEHDNQVIAYLTKRSIPSFKHFSPKCDSEGITNLKFLGALFVKVVTFFTLTLTLVRNFMFATENIWNLTHPSRLSVSY